MWKLIFGGIVLAFLIGAVFLIGYVLGTTVTPLPPADANAAAGFVSAVISHD